MKRILERPTLNMNDLNKIKPPDVEKCDKCSCTWLEQIEVGQYATTHTTAMGQPLPPLDQITFIILRCPKCSELMSPRVQLGQRDALRKLYDAFLDEMEEPLPDGSSGEKI